MMGVLFESDFENGFAGMTTGADAGCVAEVQGAIVYAGNNAARFYIDGIIKQSHAAVTVSPVDKMSVDLALYLIPPVNVYEKINFLKLKDSNGDVLTAYVQLLPTGYLVRVLNHLSGVSYNSEYQQLTEGWYLFNIAVTRDSLDLSLNGIVVTHQEINMFPYSNLITVWIGNLWSDVVGGSNVIIDNLTISYPGLDTTTVLTINAPDSATKGSPVNVSGTLTRIDGALLPGRTVEISVDNGFIGSVVTDASGRYTIQTTFEVEGIYNISAYYPGEPDLLPSQADKLITISEKTLLPIAALLAAVVVGVVIWGSK